MEEMIKGEIKKLWKSYSGYLMENLIRLRRGLIEWAKTIKRTRGKLKRGLT